VSYLSHYTGHNKKLGGNDMAHQIRSFVLRLATKVNVHQLLALSLALGAVIMGMPGGGGGGTG
jgi:hypothetical protein